jgi:hypothetical protein
MQLARGIQNRDGDRFLVHIHPDILHAIHVRALLFVVGSSRTLQTLLQKKGPFILRRVTGH